VASDSRWDSWGPFACAELTPVETSDVTCKHLRLADLPSVHVKRYRCKDCDHIVFRRATAFGDLRINESLKLYKCNYTTHLVRGKVTKRERSCGFATVYWDGDEAWCPNHIPIGREAKEEDNRRMTKKNTKTLNDRKMLDFEDEALRLREEEQNRTGDLKFSKADGETPEHEDWRKMNF